jgi:hypothetical protein
MLDVAVEIVLQFDGLLVNKFKTRTVSVTNR